MSGHRPGPDPAPVRDRVPSSSPAAPSTPAAPPSSPAPEPRSRGPWHRFWHRGGLQRHLLLRTVAVVALVAVLLSTATTLGVRQLLVSQIDDQLSTAVGRVPRAQASSPRPDAPPAGVNLPGQALGTVVLLSDGEQAYAGIQTEQGAALLSAETADPLLGVTAGAGPTTVVLPGLGRYRVTAEAVGQNEAAVLVVGLPLAPVDTTLTRLLALEVLLTALAVGGAVLATRSVVVRSLRPLNRLAGTAQRVSDLELDRGEVALSVRVPPADADPSTEVGRVGLALNQMLGHVEGALAARQASENRLRRFVADASHELRNPLASIRGYAELTRRGEAAQVARGGAALPPDAAFSLGRVEAEATRMSRLVEDLLLLARLDSGPALQLGAVDASELVVNATSDARVAGPDHRWSLDLPEVAVIAAADRHQLHQVVVNLLANARTHTPAGTHVRAGLAAADGWALITVADDGPGIPTETQPAVFERFTRADTARARVGTEGGRTPSGTGLGLAIVAAVVQAHRGRVDVTSRPGRTVFTVAIPLADQAEEPAHPDQGGTTVQS